MSKIPKNLEWSQNDDFIFIKIPKINSINNSEVNSLITNSYIKLNIGAYFFYEFFLLSDIVSDESVCKLLENCIKLKLKKKEKIFWTELLSPVNFSDKSEKLTLKTNVLEENGKNDQENEQKERLQRRDDKKAMREKEMERQSDLRSKTEQINTDMKMIALQKVSKNAFR